MTATFAKSAPATAVEVDSLTAPWAGLLLRVVTGAWFVTHGLTKFFVFTPAGTEQFFQSLGLPGWLGLFTMAAEFFGGIALILGVATRYVSVLMGLILLGATFSDHIHNGFGFTNQGGGWEYTVLWAAAQFALALIGDGRYALLPLGRR